MRDTYSRLSFETIASIEDSSNVTRPLHVPPFELLSLSPSGDGRAGCARKARILQRLRPETLKRLVSFRDRCPLQRPLAALSEANGAPFWPGVEHQKHIPRQTVRQITELDAERADKTGHVGMR